MISKHQTAVSGRGGFTVHLLIAAVLMVPLVFLPELFLDPFNIPKLAVLAIVSGVAMVIIPLEKRSLGGSGLRVPALLVAVPTVLAWALSPFPGETLVGQYQTFLGLLPSLLPVVFSVLLAPRLAGRVPMGVGALVAAAAVASLYGFAQAMGLDPLRLYFEGQTSIAPTTTLGNTNFAGGFLAIVLPLTLYFWNNSGKARYLALASTCLIALTLILTLSQGAWAAAVGGVCVAVILGSRLGRRSALRVSAAVVAGLSVVLVASVALVTSGIEVPTGGGGAKERAMFWQGAIAMSADRPLTGWGPDAYAVKIPAYRSPASFLDYPYQSPEDPHSVPLATLANSGLIGLLGFFGLFAWIIGRIRSSERLDPLLAGIGGALAAYWLQSLVSIDQPSLRFVLWVLVAALAAATSPKENGGPRPALSGLLTPGIRKGFVGALGLFIAAAGLIFALSDVKARSALSQSGPSAPQRSRLLLQEALDLREEFTYRELLVSRVAAELITGHGDEVLDPMTEAFGPLADSPHPAAGLVYGRLLHYVAPDQPAVVAEAITWIRHARRLDPHNPLVQIELAEALTTAGDPQAAESVLVNLERRLPGAGNVYSEYWPAMSVAQLASNDLIGAEEAASTALRIHNDECATSAASELVRAHTSPAPPTSTELLTLNIQCDAEYYNLFLHRLPPAERSRYT